MYLGDYFSIAILLLPVVSSIHMIKIVRLRGRLAVSSI